VIRIFYFITVLGSTATLIIIVGNNRSLAGFGPLNMTSSHPLPNLLLGPLLKFQEEHGSRGPVFDHLLATHCGGIVIKVVTVLELLWAL
jgi:hypothetical protein